ncbi:RGS domain-containing protein [Gamsiella multidivaricata]|uniref:RGS domain-containing protein n=1 Tax=Gamsiella multidivaricata TaxID=101098 RepID=UPI00221E87AE|nr:RGS domain-containing protein [Gamsiella multidivaricata]KAG0363794.1 hypothetical protein BGZ54_008041 [Gamsiella multidivaricata]KAI7816131.1 RGS domain-containing protein [Gamsiella multidivaricata]
MHQQSALSTSPPSPSSQYFSPSTHRQRHSFASFNSHHSADEDDSPLSRPTLHQILLNQGRGQYTLDNFGAFLQSQFCYENLAFWLASRQYKLCAQSLYQSVHQSVPMFNLHAESAQYLNQSQARAFSDLQRKMRAILDTFVLPSSPHELNLSDAVRCRLLRSVAEGNYHPQVLEQARESIMDLMKCSSYPLFVEGIAAKRASSTGSAQSEKSLHDHDNNSWRHKAKHHFKLVSKMLKRSP